MHERRPWPGLAGPGSLAVGTKLVNNILVYD
jgi:hypothetical protein